MSWWGGEWFYGVLSMDNLPEGEPGSILVSQGGDGTKKSYCAYASLYWNLLTSFNLVYHGIESAIKALKY